jgi:hypothetical protein
MADGSVGAVLCCALLWWEQHQAGTSGRRG